MMPRSESARRLIDLAVEGVLNRQTAIIVVPVFARLMSRTVCGRQGAGVDMSERAWDVK